MAITFKPNVLIKTFVFPERFLYHRIRKRGVLLKKTLYLKNNKGIRQTPEYYAHLVNKLFEEDKKKKDNHPHYINAKKHYDEYKKIIIENNKEIEKQNSHLKKVHIQFHGKNHYSLLVHKQELTQEELEFDKLHHLLEWMEKWVDHYSHEFSGLTVAIIKENKKMMIDLLVLIYKTAIHIKQIKTIIRKEMKHLLRKDKAFSEKDKEKIEKYFEKFHDELVDELKENWKGYQTQIQNEGWKFIFTKSRKEVLNTRSQKAKLFYSKVHAKKSLQLRYEIKDLIAELRKAKEPEEALKAIKELLHDLEEKVKYLCEASDSSRAYLHFLEHTILEVKHNATKIGINHKHKEEVHKNFEEIEDEWKETFFYLEDLSKKIFYYYGKKVTLLNWSKK